MTGNIVKIIIEGKAFWILIDLDASCTLGALAGQKVTSSAFFPPEMARRELDKRNEKTESEVETVKATRQFEMWYYGLLLLQLSTVDAPTLWQSTQADNILETTSDMQSIAYFWDTMKLEKVGAIQGKEWTAAADLTLWLLQGKASRRPESMHHVLEHQFFKPGGRLRYLDSVDETMNLFVQRIALQLHRAIMQNDTKFVAEVFEAGSVHCNLCLQGDHLTHAQKSITPLQRAARYGRLEIVQILIGEVDSQGLPDVLDTVTIYDHTALHLACA